MPMAGSAGSSGSRGINRPMYSQSTAATAMNRPPSSASRRSGKRLYAMTARSHRRAAAAAPDRATSGAWRWSPYTTTQVKPPMTTPARPPRTPTREPVPAAMAGEDNRGAGLARGGDGGTAAAGGELRRRAGTDLRDEPLVEQDRPAQAVRPPPRGVESGERAEIGGPPEHRHVLGDAEPGHRERLGARHREHQRAAVQAFVRHRDGIGAEDDVGEF